MKLDLHLHTNFSDGQPTYKEVIDRAKEKGLDYIAITDHFDAYDPAKHIPKRSDQELLDYFKIMKEYAQAKQVNLLCGIETCTDEKGNIRISDKVYNRCEIIITSPHYVAFSGEFVAGEYFNQRYWEAYKEKIILMARGKGHVLGHPEGYLPIGPMLKPNTTTFESRQEICKEISNRYFDTQFLEELSKALLCSNKAYELHCYTRTPREKTIEFMAKQGVSFSIGTDAHLLDWVGNTEWGTKMVKKYNGQVIDPWRLEEGKK